MCPVGERPHGIDEIALRNRRGNVGRAGAGRIVPPEELAGLRIDARHALLQELDILLAAGRLGDGDRRVRRLVPARHGRFPNHVARLLVKRQERGLAAAGRADQRVAINERRFGVRPLAGLAAEIGLQILLPTHVAASRFQAD